MEQPPQVLPRIPVTTVCLKKYIHSDVRQQSKDHCWAFAIACAIEIMHNKLEKNVRDQRKLSPQDLINCIPVSPDKESVSSLHKVRRWLRDTDQTKANGVCQEKDVWYAKRKKPITANRHMLSKVQVDDLVTLDSVDEDLIVQLLNNHVPVVVIITATNELKALQADEIYSGARNRADENDETKKHAILVVGYGENGYGQRCFLVWNSWDKTWGRDGYGWVQMGRNLFQSMAYPIKEQ